jgi:hypothetical protein
MAAKLCPKIILAGARLTRKTDIAFALNEHPRIVGPRKYRYHSPLISGEWCAFTNVPWGRGLINFNADEEALAMETYDTWCRLFELQKYYSWIVDRFHISTIVYQRLYNNRGYDFLALEQRLLPLNFRVVYCHRQPDTFTEARNERLAVSGKPDQYDDLDRFIKEQEQFDKVLRQSILPVLRVDVSDDSVDSIVNEIADWLESTGGLTMQD